MWLQDIPGSPFSPALHFISANLRPRDLRHKPRGTSVFIFNLSPSSRLLSFYTILSSSSSNFLSLQSSTLSWRVTLHNAFLFLFSRPGPLACTHRSTTFFCASDEAQAAFGRGKLRSPEHIYDELDAYLGLYGNQEALTSPVPEPFLTRNNTIWQVLNYLVLLLMTVVTCWFVWRMLRLLVRVGRGGWAEEGGQRRVGEWAGGTWDNR
jgi:hypothetical protein